MKIKLKFLALLLVLALSIPVMPGCGEKLEYTASALADGQVGIAYSADVNTATGAEGISYSLKSGSTLPDGLELASDGKISGTPTAAVSKKMFTVVAAAEKLTAEATFSLTIAQGATELSYVGGTLSTQVNTVSEISVATATGASSVTYTLKSGTLPDGLTFNNGAITGTPVKIGESNIVVTAAADGFDSVDAQWTIKVREPALVFENFTADNCTVGIYYTAMLAKAEGSKSITYAVETGSKLPEGLALESDGLIHGKVSKAGNSKFKVTASAKGFVSTSAEVSLLARMGDDASVAAGTITYKGKALPDAMKSVKYISLSTADAKNTVATGSSSNFNPITYALASGKLPEGMDLFENGTLYGTPAEEGTFTFSVTASAAKCEAVTAEFTLKVTPPQVDFADFKKITEVAVVGTNFTYNIGDAEAAGATVTYDVKKTTPTPAGLTLSSSGVLSGTPTSSARLASFTVIASAEGYTAKECEVSLKINDKEVIIEAGKMEAEYIDLTGKVGSGYSGAAMQEEMVQYGPNLGDNLNTSNNYFIGYTHCVLKLDFKFTSSAAAGGVKIDIGLGSELGNVTFTKKEFEVILNGTALNYNGFAMNGSAGSWGKFGSFSVTNSASLKEGENVITLLVKENTFLRGTGTGGPGIDFIQITSSATLKWTPCLYNTVGR